MNSEHLPGTDARSRATRQDDLDEADFDMHPPVDEYDERINAPETQINWDGDPDEEDDEEDEA